MLIFIESKSGKLKTFSFDIDWSLQSCKIQYLLPLSLQEGNANHLWTSHQAIKRDKLSFHWAKRGLLMMIVEVHPILRFTENKWCFGLN